MRYTDNLTPRPLQSHAFPQDYAPLTLADIAAQLVRMETRMVKLMYHVGLDASGRVREEN